jgi:hypothetical protein
LASSRQVAAQGAVALQNGAGLHLIDRGFMKLI